MSRSRLSGQLAGLNRGLIAAGERYAYAVDACVKPRKPVEMRAEDQAPKQAAFGERIFKDSYAASDRYDFWRGRYCRALDV
jgi:hypothetical protein